MAQLINCVKYRGRLEQVKSLVDRGCNLNHQDERLQTVLHWCHIFGEAEHEETGISVVRLLLNRGADINATDDESQTPLNYFIESECRTELISVLLDYRPDVTIQNMYGLTALHNYSRLKTKSLDVLRRMCEGLPDVDLLDGDGETPLMHYLMYGSKKEYIKFLLDAGSDVTVRSYNGNSVLHYYPIWCFESFFYYDDLEILGRIIDGGCPVNAKNYEGETPLMLSMTHQLPVKQVQFLLDRGANVNERDENGNTVLHFLIPQINEVYMDVIQMLLAYGGNPNAINKYGERILKVASVTGKDDCVKLFYNYGMNNGLSEDDIRTFTENYPAFLHGQPLYTAVKCALLENEAILDRHITPNLPHYNQLRAHVDRLLKELIKIKSHVVVYKLTLWDFIVETDRRKYARYVKNFSINYEVLNSEFPEYSDIVKSRIEFAKRLSRMLSNFERLSISSVQGEKEVKLTSDCLYHILQFITDSDVGHLILASINVF